MALTNLVGAQIADDVITDSHIADGALALAKLAEAVVQADGGQALTANWDIGAFLVTNSGTCSAAGDLANKGYVDTAISTNQNNWTGKLPVDLLVDSNIADLGDVDEDNGGSNWDGGNFTTTGTRIALTAQTDASENGIYIAGTSGSGTSGAGYTILTRATDFDSTAEVTENVFFTVKSGGTYANTGWLLSTNDSSIVVDTDDIDFYQIFGPGAMSGGTAITVTGTSIAVTAGEITATELGTGAVTNTKLGADAVDGTKMADNAVDSEHITAASIDTAHFSTGAVDAAALGSSAVTTVKINDDAVDKDKVNADVAGTNVSQNADGSLELERIGSGRMYLGNGTGAALVTTKDASQTILGTGFDGSNQATLTDAPISATEPWAFRNGTFMAYGASNDYTISGSVITLNFNPGDAEVMIFRYKSTAA